MLEFHVVYKIMCVGDVLAGRVEQGFVMPEDTGCLQRLRNGAATLGNDGIHMIKGVGEVRCRIRDRTALRDLS